MNSFVVSILVFTAVLGGFTMSVCGFGMGAVVMSILPHFLPYHQSVALGALCGACTSFVVGASNFKHINWKVLAPCSFLGICSSYAAVVLSVNARGSTMLHAVGVMLIALAVYSIFFGGKLHIRPTLLNGSLAGLLGGAASGLFSMGGPPIAVYMLAAIDDNDSYRATTSTHFFFTSVISTMTRWHEGIINMGTIHMWLVMVLGMALGIFIGNKVFHNLNARKLRIAVYTYLAISGVTMLFK